MSQSSQSGRTGNRAPPSESLSPLSVHSRDEHSLDVGFFSDELPRSAAVADSDDDESEIAFVMHPPRDLTVRLLRDDDDDAAVEANDEEYDDEERDEPLQSVPLHALHRDDGDNNSLADDGGSNGNSSGSTSTSSSSGSSSSSELPLSAVPLAARSDDDSELDEQPAFIDESDDASEPLQAHTLSPSTVLRDAGHIENVGNDAVAFADAMLCDDDASLSASAEITPEVTQLLKRDRAVLRQPRFLHAVLPRGAAVAPVPYASTRKTTRSKSAFATDLTFDVRGRCEAVRQQRAHARQAVLDGKVAEGDTARKRLLRQRFASETGAWRRALASGDNLFVYGAGDPERFLNTWLASWIPGRSCVTVGRCDHPTTTIKDVIFAVAHQTPAGTALLRGLSQPLQQARAVAHYIGAQRERQSRRSYFLVLFAVDAEAFQATPTVYQCIAELCSAAPALSVIATARTAPTPLLFSTGDAAKMRWHYVNLSLLTPFRVELVRSKSKSAASGRATSYRAAVNILHSVARKSALVLRHLIALQLAQPDQRGVLVSALYQACHAEFVVASVGELRAQLVEFRTHYLVRTLGGSGHNERLVCSLTTAEQRHLLKDIDQLL